MKKGKFRQKTPQEDNEIEAFYRIRLVGVLQVYTLELQQILWTAMARRELPDPAAERVLVMARDLMVACGEQLGKETHGVSGE